MSDMVHKYEAQLQSADDEITRLRAALKGDYQ